MIANCLRFDLFDLDFFTVSSILVLWTEEVSGRCPETHEGRLPLDPHPLISPSGLATSIFSLSSLEPKSLRMVILTLILVQVLCCLYQSPKHYIEIWHKRPFSLQPRLPAVKAAGQPWPRPGPAAPWGPLISGWAGHIRVDLALLPSFVWFYMSANL